MENLTNEEIAELRRLTVAEAAETSSSDVLMTPSGGMLVSRLLADGRLLLLLDEVSRQRGNLEALHDNLRRWPASMTRERLMREIHAALNGMMLETLT